MSRLKEYVAKRKLDKTPEPPAVLRKSTEKQLAFVVQKHDASHLHYDFRLEVNGVLKSWAIPKGPSMNPADKRLAMMVEDHPFDYRTFEGNIPKGNYGAGSVMVWDEGVYTIPDASTRKANEKAILQTIEKGHLDFILFGHKLKGEFSLIRMKNQSGKDNAWLLIKKKDAYATTKEITLQDKSVVTNRTQDEIADQKKAKEIKKAVKPKSKDKTIDLKDAVKADLPKEINPMLGVLGKEPFDREGWLFEVKWDGYRAIGQVQNHKVQLYSRNQLSFNKQFPTVAEALEKLPVKSAVLDGEIVILDKQGIPSFQLMQNYQKSHEGAVYYYVFDLLYLDGYDLRKMPLIERKEILKQLIERSNSEVIHYSDYVLDKGKALFKLALKSNLEGVMAKDGASTYQSKRSRDWIKIKTHRRQEVVIGGITQPQGSREKFGALLVGVYEGKKFKYIGKVGGGFTLKLLKDVYEQLKPLIRSDSPFKDAPKSIRSVTWVEPKLVCEVSFAEWTTDDRLRQPIFKGLRFDKEAKKVKKESYYE